VLLINQRSRARSKTDEVKSTLRLLFKGLFAIARLKSDIPLDGSARCQLAAVFEFAGTVACPAAFHPMMPSTITLTFL
jgi:hypothetical protein